jgi:hypothetical protein
LRRGSLRGLHNHSQTYRNRNDCHLIQDLHLSSFSNGAAAPHE